MKDRVLRLFQRLDPAPDAIVLANSVDPHLDRSFFYVFDVPSGLFEGSIAIAHPDGKVEVVSSLLEEESARQAAKHDPDVTVHVMKDSADRDKILQKAVRSDATVGLNYSELTHEWFLRMERALPKAKWVDASAAVRKTRQIKDPTEIDRLRRAGAIGTTVAEKIPGLLRKGMTEQALAAEIEYAMSLEGASSPSFSTIVGFGPDSAEPHFSPGERVLESGMSIVCDFGAYYRRYASDITRSFHFGRRDEEMKRVHDTVFEAQAAALKVLRPGAIAKDVHGAAQAVIDASPWKGRFTHGLGHSIGLAVHDGFAMNPNIDDVIEAGMTITIEPGIYLTGHGGVRIEDDVVVTAHGYEFLTKAPREYLEVSA
jgi:Xaa-Pro aminopeptidase